MKRIATLLVAIGFGLVMLTPPGGAGALSGNQFESNRIIDDGVFFNPNAISLGNIQAFLNAKVPNCDTNGAQLTSHWNSSQNRFYNRAEWGALNGHPAPFVCLKDYRQNTGNKPAEPGICNGYGGASNQSAAEIIFHVAHTCGINPQVLLILLQKEQSLVTDSWPWSIQYTKATGFGCPDTAACNPEYAGFFNQVYHAARQYKRYRANPNIYAHAVGRASFVGYHPNGACSGGHIFMFTSSTAGLYNYTPYQPNSAALNNLYGAGDGCSSYGNRNFWRLFNDWFGPTTRNSAAHQIDLIRLNHGSGKAEIVSLSSISDYTYFTRNGTTGYPATNPDGAVIPVVKSNGSLSFVRLNHGSGKAEIVTYGEASGYKNMIQYEWTGYPATNPDGAVIPLFKPNNDLSFVRLNHGSGKAEVVTYSASSGYKQLVEYTLTGYPATNPDGAVIPRFKPNGSLSFIRLNHGSGRAEIVTYSEASGYKKMIEYSWTGYPATNPDGAVIPLFQPNFDLSFIRLNHHSGRTEVVTVGSKSSYRQVVDHQLTNYPAVTPDGAVIPLFSR